MKNELIEKLITYVAEEDLISNIREVNQLKVEFDDWLLKAEGQQQVETLKAKDVGKQIEQIDFSIFKERFYSLYGNYKENRKKQIEIKNQLEDENLRQKKVLITELKNLVENEENIGSAFKSFNSIQDTWKKIGDLPRSKRDEVQKEYSRLREMFFYNINMYREIKEHDYKRNFQLKKEIIFKLQSIRNSENQIKEIERGLRLLQDEWEDIGPVSNDEWEGLKSSYWEAVRSIYDKINKHYDEYRQIQFENLNKKRALIQQLKSKIIQEEGERTLKQWNQLTSEVKKIQDDWKKIGYASKKDNDKIWKEFRGVCNGFFDDRKAFFKSKDDVDKVARDQKKELIEKAKSFNNVSDFSSATKGLIQLQKQWKTVKNAGRYERSLWEEFRKECDAFFNRKEEAYKDLKQSYVENLEAKKEALYKLKKQTVDSQTDLSSIKDSMASFISIGPVSRDQSGYIMKEFITLLKDKLSLMKLDKTQIELIIYKFKIDSYALMENRTDYFSKEKKMLKKKLSSLQNEMFQSENNMGYFSISKGAEKLFDQVNKKNDQIKEEITLIRRQLKLIPNE
tara:strand:+ start:1200 stop:2897 length:1698 start_codon:yes stop_codon:yes gene_type:complete